MRALPVRPPLLARIALWALPVGVAGLALLVVERARAEAELGQAGVALAYGRAADARALLDPWRESGRFGSRARAGLALASALDGTRSADSFGAADLASFRPRLLMESALRERRTDVLRRLAILSRDHGDAAATVYEAAADVEQGDDAAARALIAAHPEIAASPFLGARIARVLDAHAAGAVLTVADRRGALAGFFDARGDFHPEAGGPADWIPPALLPAAGTHRAGVRLATDFDLSAMALRALGSFRGSVVLIDLATGGVLAAVSDARTRAAEGGTPAFEQRREPASIEKIMTTAASLRAGHDPNAEISRMVCHGSQRYKGGILWCSYPAGPLTGGLREAFALSCNIAFANLAIEIGWAGMVDELRRWGFDRPSAELPGAGRILQTSGTERELASLGIGLDVAEITPLHAALLGSVLARGAMPQPALVAADDGVLALSPQALPAAPGRRLLEPEWVPLMQDALGGVVEEGGTAEGVVPPSFPVVMKTGTAAAPGVGYHVNYVGAGPLPHPTIGFAVRVTHQPTSARARGAGQEVLAEVLEELGRRRPRLAAAAEPVS